MIDATSPPADIEQVRRQHLDMLIDADATEMERYGTLAGRLYPENWRNAITLDFGQCDHNPTQIVEVKAVRYEVPTWAQIELGARTEEVELGVWGMEICLRCGTQVRKECPHIKTEWLFDGKLLVCLNCGVNCT